MRKVFTALATLLMVAVVLQFYDNGPGDPPRPPRRTAERCRLVRHGRHGFPSSGSPLWMDTFDVRPGQV